jgi:hypothetical protein
VAARGTRSRFAFEVGTVMEQHSDGADGAAATWSVVGGQARPRLLQPSRGICHRWRAGPTSPPPAVARNHAPMAETDGDAAAAAWIGAGGQARPHLLQPSRGVRHRWRAGPTSPPPAVARNHAPMAEIDGDAAAAAWIGAGAATLESGGVVEGRDSAAQHGATVDGGWRWQ